MLKLDYVIKFYDYVIKDFFNINGENSCKMALVTTYTSQHHMSMNMNINHYDYTSEINEALLQNP